MQAKVRAVGYRAGIPKFGPGCGGSVSVEVKCLGTHVLCDVSVGLQVVEIIPETARPPLFPPQRPEQPGRCLLGCTTLLASEYIYYTSDVCTSDIYCKWSTEQESSKKLWNVRICGTLQIFFVPFPLYLVLDASIAFLSNEMYRK